MKIKVSNKQNLEISNTNGHLLAIVNTPVILEYWDGLEEHGSTKLQQAYDTIRTEGKGVIATAKIQKENFGKVFLEDYFAIDNNAIILKRKLKVLEGIPGAGIRLWWDMTLYPEEKPSFEELRYFAPPAVFDKNDLDEDGYEDYFHTQRLIYRDDRFNYPLLMAYNEKEKEAFRLERYALPKYDSIPERKKRKNGVLENVFLQKTDIGSMGVVGEKDKSVHFSAAYPFYEGDATIGLYIVKTVPFGAFWNMDEGEELEISYRFSNELYKDFHQACWGSISYIINEKKPQAPSLPTDIETLIDWRLRSLNEYYVEKNSEEDKNCPAGFVLNCHPQDGKQLENIIQYGFTGQNIMNACNILRYGKEKGNPEYIRRALKIADFFVDKMQISESGIFYNLYNVDMKKMNFWWTGLLLPLAYARDGELKNLMGPLYEYRKGVIDCLTEIEGAYLRCMNEDVTALFRLYRLEKKNGRSHENWMKAIEKYCEFLLNTQEADGGWRRAYDITGKPITEPSIWFGNTVYEQKSSTATSISLLVEMYECTKKEKYLQAAIKAGHFVKTYIIDRVRFNGGVHDSIYAKGQLIDNESILYPMFGMLSLYEVTKDEEFLEGAVRAAHFHASWACLWNVPLPKDSTLARYGFNSIGMGACDTCGAGYVHPFQLMGIAEMVQIAIYAKDLELLRIAELYWKGCNQTVSIPENDWGYASYGLQEEGYLVSWWAVDDPMFSADTGFGNRLKGEGNKTCFPWIAAVAVKGYYEMLDRFQTVDFQKIEHEYF